MPRKTPQDPTGQARNRRRGTAALDRRLANAERRIKRQVRAIPRSPTRHTVIVNEQRTSYEWDYNAQDEEELNATVQGVLDEELLETQVTNRMPLDWFWIDYVEPAYRQGAIEDVNTYNDLIAAAIIAGFLLRGRAPQPVPPDEILFSQIYAEQLRLVEVSNFRTIRTLSERTAAQVMQVINDGIQAGLSVTEVTQQITERFEVSRSNAERISRTEINKAYNTAQLNTTEQISEISGARVAVYHISALLPMRTRPTHAARHGNIYTPQDQARWWDQGTNRINCYCSVENVLIDSDGKPLDPARQTQLKSQKVGVR